MEVCLRHAPEEGLAVCPVTVSSCVTSLVGTGYGGKGRGSGKYRVGVCSEQSVADEHIHTSTQHQTHKTDGQMEAAERYAVGQTDGHTCVCTTVWLDHERLSCQMCFHFPLPILLDCGNVSTSHEPSTKYSHKILLFFLLPSSRQVVQCESDGRGGERSIFLQARADEVGIH